MGYCGGRGGVDEDLGLWERVEGGRKGQGGMVGREGVREGVAGRGWDGRGEGYRGRRKEG